MSTTDVALLLSLYCSISTSYFACIVPLLHIHPSNLLYNARVPYFLTLLCFLQCFVMCSVLVYISQRAQVTKELKAKHLWRHCSIEEVGSKPVSVYKSSASYKQGDVVKMVQMMGSSSKNDDDNSTGYSYWKLTGNIRRSNSKHGSSSSHNNAPPVAPLPDVILRWHDGVSSLFALDSCLLADSPLFHALMLLQYIHCSALLIAACALPHLVIISIISFITYYTVSRWISGSGSG